MFGAGDVRVETVADPIIGKPTVTVIGDGADGYTAMDDRTALKVMVTP